MLFEKQVGRATAGAAQPTISLRASHIAAAGAPQGLAECAGQDVDAVDDAARNSWRAAARGRR